MKRNLIYHTHVRANDQVVACTEQGRFETHLEAIARDGLTLTCNRETLDRLFPNTLSIAPRQPKHIDVEFAVPGTAHQVESRCEVFSLRRLSRDTYQLDMKFENIAEKHAHILDQYIEHTFKKTAPAVNQAA